jgi:hypothetical protein
VWGAADTARYACYAVLAAVMATDAMHPAAARRHGAADVFTWLMVLATLLAPVYR